MPMFVGVSNCTVLGGTFIEITTNHDEPIPMVRPGENTIQDMLSTWEPTCNLSQYVHLPADERHEIMAWASPINVSAKQLDISNTRQLGTGKWLLKTDTYQQWEAGTGQALWCPGIPGAGKTVLTSLIIDHLRALQLREPAGTIGVAWFYFNYKEEQTPDTVLLSLIRQLAGASAELYKLLKSSYMKDNKNPPSPWQLISDMDTLTRDFSKVFIVIDALDECAERYRGAFLEVMARLQRASANILITSRDDVHNTIVHSRLADLQRVDILASTGDITSYVNVCLIKERRLAQITKSYPSLRNKVVTTIVDSCQGMFLMAKFHIEGLKKKINAGEVIEALEVLPRTFHSVYDNAMKSLEDDKHYSGVVLRVLSFLIYARRQLTLLELQHFLAVSLADTDFHDEFITNKDILLPICAGLVVHDETTGIVRLVHFTAQEYFDEIRKSKFPEGDLEMGHICLVYISFNAFKNVVNLTNDFLNRYALLDYILHHWHEHIVNHQEALRSPLLDFFANGLLLQTYSQLMQKYNHISFNYHARIIKDLHVHERTALDVAAATGLLLVVQWLITDSAELNSEPVLDRLNNALITASIHGREAVVKLLIENGANINTSDINTSDNTGRTPLMVASHCGHTAVVKLLIKNGANVNMQDRRRSTALIAASTDGYDEVVKLLIENDANMNMQDIWRNTALIAASACGHAAVVELLLENGADTHTVGMNGTALEAALNQGREAVAELLLTSRLGTLQVEQELLNWVDVGKDGSNT